MHDFKRSRSSRRRGWDFRPPPSSFLLVCLDHAPQSRIFILSSSGPLLLLSCCLLLHLCCPERERERDALLPPSSRLQRPTFEKCAPKNVDGFWRGREGGRKERIDLLLRSAQLLEASSICSTRKKFLEFILLVWGRWRRWRQDQFLSLLCILFMPTDFQLWSPPWPEMGSSNFMEQVFFFVVLPLFFLPTKFSYQFFFSSFPFFPTRVTRTREVSQPTTTVAGGGDKCSAEQKLKT